MKGTFGLISNKLLAQLDQNTLSWKMSGGISASDSKKFLKTLPKSGMMQNGELYEQVMLAHPIKEQDCSLLPTPAARDYKGPGTRSMTLPLALLPTPTVIHVRNYDEPIEVFMERQAKSSTGQIGKSVGLALRLQNREIPPTLVENKLNPKFVEYMMGLPEGWVTDLDISRSQQLKILGNGVVPQQAYYALQLLCDTPIVKREEQMNLTEALCLACQQA
jgi:hypothetical protein